MTIRHDSQMVSAFVDGEMTPDEMREFATHVESCVACQREIEELTAMRGRISGALPKYPAPDILHARVRAAIGTARHPVSDVGRTSPASLWRLIAAGMVVAAVSSAVTFGITRRAPVDPVISDVVASHIRSLIPGHLTDVVSTDQHNVKPWFNGRVELSPPVPNLDSAGFTLVGGRIDYIGGRFVPVVVYSRRKHLINVYARPAADDSPVPVRRVTANGYNVIEWRGGGFDHWVISDLNVDELKMLPPAFGGPTR